MEQNSQVRNIWVWERRVCVYCLKLFCISDCLSGPALMRSVSYHIPVTPRGLISSVRVNNFDVVNLMIWASVTLPFALAH